MRKEKALRDEIARVSRLMDTERTQRTTITDMEYLAGAAWALAWVLRWPNCLPPSHTHQYGTPR